MRLLCDVFLRSLVSGGVVVGLRGAGCCQRSTMAVPACRADHQSAVLLSPIGKISAKSSVSTLVPSSRVRRRRWVFVPSPSQVFPAAHREPERPAAPPTAEAAYVFKSVVCHHHKKPGACRPPVLAPSVGNLAPCLTTGHRVEKVRSCCCGEAA